MPLILIRRYGRRQSHVLRERRLKEQQQQASENSDVKQTESLQPSSSRCSELSAKSATTNAVDNDPLYCKVDEDSTKSLTPTIG